MRPFITIEKKAQEALDFYDAIFPSYSLISLNHHAEPHQDLVMLAVFSVKEQEIMKAIVLFLMNGESPPESHFLWKWIVKMNCTRFQSLWLMVVKFTCLQIIMDFRSNLLGLKTSLGLIGK